MTPPEAKRVAYFPGCMSVDCARELDMSLRAVLKTLDVEPVELADWNCCGGTLLDETSARPLAARILKQASAISAELVCACPICAHRLSREAESGTIAVSSALEMLTEPHMLALIEQRRKESLEGLKVVCYYGPRPRRNGDEEEQRRSGTMEQLLRACGLSVLKWPGRRQPHGGNAVFTRPALMRALAGRLLRGAMEAGADFLVLDDPHAQLNLDLFQYPIGRELKRPVELPVLFAVELVADGKTSGLFREHQTDYAWIARQIDLTAWKGRRVILRFITDSGPHDSSTADHAHWGDVRLARSGELSLPPLEAPGSIMAWAGDGPFEATFYFRDIGHREVDVTFEAEGGEAVLVTNLRVYNAPDAMARAFRNGLVLANPSSRPYTFDLDALYPNAKLRKIAGKKTQDPVTNNGQPVGTAVTLPAEDALFLVRAE